MPGAILAAVVGAQWLLLSAAAAWLARHHPARVRASARPSAWSARSLLSRRDVLGPPGYLYGFGAGQLVTLALLLWGTLRALPAEEDEDAHILPAFRDYWLLAAAALAFHAGLWVDKLGLPARRRRPASRYASMAAVAWLSVVPAVRLPLRHRRDGLPPPLPAFYSSLHTGASLAELEQLAPRCAGGGAHLARHRRGPGGRGAPVPAARPAGGGAALAPGSATILRWLMVGAALQVLAVATTLLLYYFDFRQEALISRWCSSSRAAS